MENTAKKRQKLHVKKGDTVLVLVGKSQKDGGDKGKKAKVLSTSPKRNQVVVENVNMQKKHRKARSAQDTGGIIDKNGPIHVSNVQVICPGCKKNTRVGKSTETKGKVTRHIRICKKCGESLDKGIGKIDKKKKEEKPVKEEKAKKEKKTKKEDK
jgi:large subunit ribosomal protein L24